MTERVVPQLPGGPDPTQPVPEEPVEGIDLEAYATLSARLIADTAPREALLAQAGLNERLWLRVERTWLLRLAAAALRGELALARRYDAAYVAAQDALVEGQPLVPLDRFANLVAQIEAGRAAPLVLAEAGVSPAAFAASQRAWASRFGLDQALICTFRAIVEQWKRDNDAGDRGA